MDRRFQLFCIGSGKTGTKSAAKAFGNHYKSCHEPLPSWTARMAIDYDCGTLTGCAAQVLLRARDRDLKLEVESSHPLGFMPDPLAKAFPHAGFLVTIRNPVSWIKSRIDYSARVDPPGWREFREYFWQCEVGTYHNEDVFLKDLGLYAVEQYFNVYERQYRGICRDIPTERIFTMRTSSFSDPYSLARLAEFCGVEPDTIVLAHANKMPFKDHPGPSTHLDEEWLTDLSRTLCPTAWELWETGI